MRIRLWLHLLFAMFAVFLTLPKSLGMLTAAHPTKSARLADFSSATTTTPEKSVLRRGGEIGFSAACRGPAKAFHVPLTGIPRRNCGIFAEADRSLAAKTTTRTADEAAKWIWGQNEGVAKFNRQLDQRGWNRQQATEAIKGGLQFNVVVEGQRGIITTFENLSQKSLDRLGKNYGWK